MSLRLQSDQREFLGHSVGVPDGLRLENLHPMVVRVLDKCRFVRPSDLLWLDKQTTKVELDGELILRTAQTRGGQSLQWTRKKDEKRGPDTNLGLNSARPTSKPLVARTPDDVNNSVEAAIDDGIRYIAVPHTSKIGMNSISLVPECLANYALAGIRLQQANEDFACGRLPLTFQVHHVHVLAPWLANDWFGGKQKALYTRGSDLSISTNCGSGYIGLIKKPFLAAHMWYAAQRGIGILHAGACRFKNGKIAVMSGASAVGKSELSMLLKMIRTPGRLEFEADGEVVYVEVPGEDGAMRKLVVDDMVAYRIELGELELIDLETGHYYRIDGYNRQGDNPLVDSLAEPGSTVPCTWSNVGYDAETDRVIPEKHVTIEGEQTDNPRLVFETARLPADTYEQTQWNGGRVKADVMISGIPAAPGLGLPAFSVLHVTQLVALTLAGLRANKGNQSIRQLGDAEWTSEGAGTLTPFSPMTNGEVAGQLMLLRQLSPGKVLCCFVSNRSCINYTEVNKYDGLWALRRVLESDIDLRTVKLRRHVSWYLGWIPELPADLIDPRLLDPSLTLPADVVRENALAFDAQVIEQLSGIELDRLFPDEHRFYLNRLRRGKIEIASPFASIQLG